jgi:hypothetical protein
VTNPVTIASFTNVPLLTGQAGTTVVLGSTASDVTVPAGKFMCLSINWRSGGPTTLQYGRNNLNRTNFTTPQVIFIPEYGLALFGMALAIPFATRFWTRRNRRAKGVA